MNPVSIGRSGPAASRTSAASSWNSASPSASRVPCPTTSSAGGAETAAFMPALRASGPSRPAPARRGGRRVAPSTAAATPPPRRARPPASARRSRARASRSGRARRGRCSGSPACRSTARPRATCQNQRASSPRAWRAVLTRRSSSSTTIRYRTASAPIAVNAAGTRSRSNPMMISGAGVVALRTPVASTTSVALHDDRARQRQALGARDERQQHDERQERDLDDQPHQQAPDRHAPPRGEHRDDQPRRPRTATTRHAARTRRSARTRSTPPP